MSGKMVAYGPWNAAKYKLRCSYDPVCGISWREWCEKESERIRATGRQTEIREKTKADGQQQCSLWVEQVVPPKVMYQRDQGLVPKYLNIVRSETQRQA